jgi:hypothetical protein
MNFVGEKESAEIQLELKYCERCGGLWLRRRGTGGVHCAACHACVAAMPDPGAPPPPGESRRRKARLKKLNLLEEDLHGSYQIGYLQGVASIEVSA